MSPTLFNLRLQFIFNCQKLTNWRDTFAEVTFAKVFLFMENMIDPWLYELRKERRERIKIVKKFLGIKPGDGTHLRYHGAYAMPDGQGYYVYHIIDDSLEGCKTGIEHYALVDPINYSCRKATPDEVLSLMMNELSPLIID